MNILFKLENEGSQILQCEKFVQYINVFLMDSEGWDEEIKMALIDNIGKAITKTFDNGARAELSVYKSSEKFQRIK